MNIGTKNLAYKNAKKLLKSLGVDFDAEYRHHLTITINDSAPVIYIYTPTNFGMSSDTMLDIANRIKSLGWCGRRMVKALIDAVNGLDQKDIDDLRTLCFVRQYKPDEAIKYFLEWVFQTTETNKVRINRRNITFKTARNLWVSFGGYRGLKHLFTEGLTTTIDEFRRLRRIEERLEVNSVIDIDNPHLGNFVADLGEYDLKPINEKVCEHKCLTCSHCRTDRYGDQFCKIGYVDIPDNITVEEVNALYPTAAVIGYGKLQSQYVFFTMTDCDCYRSRIGARVKETNTQESINDKMVKIMA